MQRQLQGHYIKIPSPGETVRAFVPPPLPPKPPIQWTPQLQRKYDNALFELGKLDSVTVLLPETSLFLYMYVRKEAVLSSMIEGTQSSLSDLLLFEMDQQPGVPLNDVQEVSNYVAALNYGLKRLEDGFPMSLRLIREIHGVLLSKGRGSKHTPGTFRRTQNWIGGTRPGNAAFVPPPPDKVLECMGALELFIHDEQADSPALLKAALAHVQFETIHPFLDGNGRLGRLLITLLLSEQKIVRKPMLYLSLYIKAHRHDYYELLNNVRMNGDWEAWLDFFAEAIIATAGQAIETAQLLLALLDRDRRSIDSLKKAAASTRKIYEALLERPIVNSAFLAEKTGLVPATINKSIRHLEKLGIVRELTSKKRNRLYSYSEYVGILNKGTELPD